MTARPSPTRILLRLIALAMLAILAMSVARRWAGLTIGQIPPQFLLYYVTPMVIAALLLFGLSFAGRETRLSAVLCLLACVPAIYGAEFYLQYQRYDVRDRVETAARNFGNQFDPRTVEEVVADLRAKGVNAHPFMRILNRGGPLMPIGNTPNRVIVWCNEIGQYLIFHSDRHGFNNPDTIWDQAPVEMAVVGDSYVHGACAPKNDGMVDRARKLLPSIVNLGIGGNSPQTNLATLVEYAPAVRPRQIVWVHYAGNDLSGMMLDKNHPFLRRYVDEPGFTQHLVDRDDEITRMMDRFFDTEYGGTNRYEQTPIQSMLKRPRNFLKFASVREALGITHWDGATVDFDLLTRIFKRTKMLADSLGSEVTVISLPHVLQAPHELEAPEQRLRDIVTGLGMKYMDAGAEMRRHGDTTSFYAFGSYGGHLSPKGNALLADMILRASDHHQPISSAR
jgi:hypothetical protein